MQLGGLLSPLTNRLALFLQLFDLFANYIPPFSYEIRGSKNTKTITPVDQIYKVTQKYIQKGM